MASRSVSPVTERPGIHSHTGVLDDWESEVRMKAGSGLLLSMVLMMSGCAAAGEGLGAGSGTPRGTSAATLDFTGELLDGSAYEGVRLAGMPAVLWFWAPWCPTCRAQAPHVEKIAAQYAGRVNVVRVGGLSDAADIREIARQVEGPTHLVDEAGTIWTHFGVTAQSTFVLLDAGGAVVSEGYLDNDVLSARVAELVG